VSGLGVLLIDQDGVLADFEQGLFDAFCARFPTGPAIRPADRRGFYAREQYEPEWRPAVNAIVRSKGFYRNLPEIAGGRAALEEMRAADHDVFVCTAPLSDAPRCAPEKLDWIERHLGRDWVDRTIIVKDKSLVGNWLKPCVLVDDRPGVSARGVASPPWAHVLFDAPYNQGEPGPRLSCWADWRAVLDPVLAAQRR